MAAQNQLKDGNLDQLLECPICFDVMKIPIIQCKSGHSMCQECIGSRVIRCPLCRGDMIGTRNFALEQLIASFGAASINKPSNKKEKCKFTHRGCKFILDQTKKAQHELDCKFREISCEGAKFCGWDCNWVGSPSDILKHFKMRHKKYIDNMYVDTEFTMHWYVEWDEDETELRLINYNNGEHFFWYKYRGDAAQQKSFWSVQLIGTSQAAQHYVYNIKFLNGPNTKCTEIFPCENDGVDSNELFESEKCIVMSFKRIKHFLNQKGELKFVYTIEKAQRHSRH